MVLISLLLILIMTLLMLANATRMNTESWGMSDERSAQLGSLVATYVIETIGTQEYELAQRHFLERFASTYGDDAASDVEQHLSCPRP